MKLAARLLVGSLVANGILFAAFSVRPALAPLALRNFFEGREARASRVQAERARTERNDEAAKRKTADRAAAMQARLWSALQTDDLRDLVARLRAAGFPASIVRAIVSAQLQARFSARMNALAASIEDTPYWRPAPNGNSFYNPKFSEQWSQIHRERSRLLRELLGDDFFASAGGDPTAAQRRQFGDLPKAKIDLVQRVEDDYAEMISQVRAATQGITLPEDREKYALLEREKRADLAALLTPQEFEDYQMRTSQITQRLRSTLTLMDATEQEFRTIFGLQQQFNDRINPPGGTFGAEMAQQRREATNQLNEQLKAALGETRTAEFTRASNYEFQNLAQLAQRENLPIDAAVHAYDLRNFTSEESLRISKDKTLTYDQQLSAMQTLAQNTKAQLAATLGPAIGAAYAKSATWLQAIEKGTVVTFDNNGTSFQFLTPPTPPPPAK